MAQKPESGGMETWAAYARRTRREMAGLEKQLRDAERFLGEQMRSLVEANRKVRLLEKLRENAVEKWTADMIRELDTLASDAFLGRLQSKERSGA